jgi:hypothetical protein
MDSATLSQKLYEKAALLGDLHRERRAPAERLAVIDKLIEKTHTEIDALVELRASLAPASAPTQPTLPDVAERSMPVEPDMKQSVMDSAINGEL